MPRTKNFKESEVLDQAIQVFWKRGFNATSIQDLVEELGINRASIYDTWGNKHQLYLSALTRYRQYTSAWLLENIRSHKPAFEILNDYLIKAVEEAISDPDKKGCFMVNAAAEMCNTDEQTNQLFKENKTTLIKVLSELIKEAQTEGSVKNNQSPETIASFLYVNIIGLRILSKSETNTEELKSIVSLTLSTLR